MEITLYHIVGELIAAPAIVWYITHTIKNKEKSDEKKLELKDKLDEERHQLVLQKINSYCSTNTNQHAEFYKGKNDLEKRVTAIETIHQIKGCNEAFGRRVTDHVNLQGI